MDPKSTEKPFDDSTVYELERSVSLCTLCELETKYLYTDTPTYSLSLPLIELSSTSNDSSSLHFTPEDPSVYDHLAADANIPRYDDIAVEGQFPTCKILKNSKKSPVIKDDDISSSFLEFVQKTAKQVPDGLLKTLWDDVSWDKSDDKRESEHFRGKTVLPTGKNSTIPEVTEDGIKSFISDIDDFLNEDEDKPLIEVLGETRVRQVSPPRSFVSDIQDEIPKKRSKISGIARRFIDTPEPKKFSERFMIRDNSTHQGRSNNFAEDFRITSAIISRERQNGEHGPLQDGAESLSEENIFPKKSTKNSKSLFSKMTLEGQKVSETTPNCTQSFMDEQVREKSRNVEMLLPTEMTPEKRSSVDRETLRYEENKMATEPPPVQFSPIYGERDKIVSQDRKDDSDIFEDDDNIPRKKLKIEETRKTFDKRSDVDDFRKPEVEELPDKEPNIVANDLSSELGKEAEVPKLQGIDHSFVEKEEIREKSIYRSSVKSLPELEEEMDTTEPEVDRAMPSDEATVEETSPKILKIIANMIVEKPLSIMLKPPERNDRAESEEPKKNHNKEVPKTNVPTNETTKTNVPTNDPTKTNVPTNEVTKTNVPMNEDRDGEKLAKKIAEAEEELPEKNERNKEFHCPEEPPIAKINCSFDHTKMAEEKFGKQLERVENCITDGVSKSPKRASRKNQNRSDTLKPEDKEKLTKSWKEVRKDFASTKDKRPRYPPLAVPKTPPLPNLKMIKARAAKRRGILTDAINRLSSLNSYMGEVRNIFRNDNKQYSIVKPTRSSNGRIKILVSTSTQTSDGGQDPVDSLPVLPTITVEGTAEKQLGQPDINHTGLFYYNLLDPQRDSKDERISAQRHSRPTQNDKSDAVAEANPQNTLPEVPLIVEKTTNLHNQEEIKHDMHSYNPLRVQRDPKRLRKIVPNKKITPASCKPLFLNRLL